MCQRQVFALHLARGNGAHQGVHGGSALGHQHQARSVLVQPVHDAGTRQAGRRGVVRQQTIEQGAAPVPRGRVHHQAGRLVDHQQMRVFVQHDQRHGLGHESHGLRRGPQLHLQDLPHVHPRSGLDHRPAGHLHRGIGHQLLQVRAGELRDQLRQRLVDAPAVHVGWHLAGAGFGLAGPVVLGGGQRTFDLR